MLEYKKNGYLKIYYKYIRICNISSIFAFNKDQIAYVLVISVGFYLKYTTSEQNTASEMLIHPLGNRFDTTSFFK